MPFELQELDGRVHQRKQFDSGNSQRDRYLRDLAGQHARLGFSRTFVLVDSGQPSEILGFYTLSAAQIDLGQLSEQEQTPIVEGSRSNGKVPSWESFSGCQFGRNRMRGNLFAIASDFSGLVH